MRLQLTLGITSFFWIGFIGVGNVDGQLPVNQAYSNSTLNQSQRDNKPLILLRSSEQFSKNQVAKRNGINAISVLSNRGSLMFDKISDLPSDRLSIVKSNQVWPLQNLKHAKKLDLRIPKHKVKQHPFLVAKQKKLYVPKTGHITRFGPTVGMNKTASPLQIVPNNRIFNRRFGFVNPYYPYAWDTPLIRPNATDNHEGWVSKFLYTRPTVSPYMGLFRHDIFPYGATKYETFVRSRVSEFYGIPSQVKTLGSQPINQNKLIPVPTIQPVPKMNHSFAKPSTSYAQLQK